MYITNVQREKLSSKSVILLYRLCWQIEIVFKAWKSYHGLEQLKGEREERIECFIYGRLIMIVIMSFLTSSIRRYLWETKKREVSFLKVIRHFQAKSSKIMELIVKPVSFADFLLDEFLETCRLCVMGLRKRLSTAQKIRIQVSEIVLA